MRNYDLGPDFSTGAEGPDRSLLAYSLTQVDLTGWAVEFGVGSGATLRMIADALPVVGFDSFEGLPEDWRPDFKRGAFRFDPISSMTNATIVPGWFADTVASYDWPEHLALVHFDADLYSSTMTCLDSIGAYIQPGCVVVFDEFFGYEDDVSGNVPGEQRAWQEFAETADLTWDVLGHGREQWAVKITARGN